MSSDTAYLALRLDGPMQSWGYDSQYNRRNTGLFPTKSAIAGMCCAALGYSRGCEREILFLSEFASLNMTAISVPREIVNEYGGEKTVASLQVRRLQDFHTVQNTRRATGSINTDCVLTHRQYLNDSSFGVILEGASAFLRNIATALENPVWGVWLGRKSCIPSSPVFAGLSNQKADAVKAIIGDCRIERFSRQEDVEVFAEGRDSLPDSPVSFLSEDRQFSPRRVVTYVEE